MIAKLSGTVDEIAADAVVIDVAGVGYQAFCSSRTLAALPAIGAPVQLWIETHVREDHIHLYGFTDRAERDWFRLLVTVQGVGARLALAILSVAAPQPLGLAILAQDKAALTRAEGVGPKLAGRIVNELRDKIGGLSSAAATLAAPAAPPPQGAAADAVSALVNLGYHRSEAFAAVAAAAMRLGGDAGADTLIRAGLQELAG
jgi:Holliday junction DNA helicase RuvA